MCGGDAVPRLSTSTFRITGTSTTTCSAPPGARGRNRWRSGTVLAGLVEAGADLILAGHIHQSTVAERDASSSSRRRAASTPSSSRSRRASASRARTVEARRAACTSTRSRRRRCASSPTSGARTAGGSRPCGRSRAAVSRCLSAQDEHPRRRMLIASRPLRGRFRGPAGVESDGRPGAAPAGDRAVDQQQGDRADDRGQPAAQIPELVHRIGVEERGSEKPPRMAPTIPMSVVMMNPPGSSPGAAPWRSPQRWRQG